MKNILEKLATGIQYLLPHHFLSGLIYRLMRIETVWIKNLQIRMISKIVGVNWSEAASEDLSDYRHFNAFFTRTLKEGSRNIDQPESNLICPCDGRISELGAIHDKSIFQAKGQDFSLVELTANDPYCEQWANGYFCTIYLSPRDYHRVHMPLAGKLVRMTHIPGRLFSVAPYTVRNVPRLFARNERLVCVFDTEIGPVAQILVGAMLVSSMATTWDGEITPSASRDITSRDYTDRAIVFAKGAEMGRFNMGSTVINLLPRDTVAGGANFLPGDKVQLGQSLIKIQSN